jgi:hypothetical protein
VRRHTTTALAIRHHCDKSSLRFSCHCSHFHTPSLFTDHQPHTLLLLTSRYDRRWPQGSWQRDGAIVGGASIFSAALPPDVDARTVRQLYVDGVRLARTRVDATALGFPDGARMTASGFELAMPAIAEVRLLTHLLTRSSAHPPAAHSLIHSPTHPHLHSHPLTHPPTHTYTHDHPSTHPPIHHPPTHSLTHAQPARPTSGSRAGQTRPPLSSSVTTRGCSTVAPSPPSPSCPPHPHLLPLLRDRQQHANGAPRLPDTHRGLHFARYLRRAGRFARSCVALRSLRARPSFLTRRAIYLTASTKETMDLVVDSWPTSTAHLAILRVARHRRHCRGTALL